MSWEMKLCVMMLLWTIRTSESFPNKPDGADVIDDVIDEEFTDPLDYDPLEEDEFDDRNGTDCGECVPELCPEALGCRAGLVLDGCGCCQECGNLEGQSCDFGDSNVFYGLCGAGLRCRVDDQNLGEGEVAEPVCVCQSQDALCGSDGRTYMNLCQFKEASFLNGDLKVKGKGPCKTVPIIKVPPQSLVNVTGSSMVFLCEVFAFPMALVEWRKDGRDVILPGDDPHISVQSRGGPLRFELSSWLQIEDAAPVDAGTYRCVARNDLGSVSATAVVGVLGSDEMEAYLSENMADMMDYNPSRDYEEDYY